MRRWILAVLLVAGVSSLLLYLATSSSRGDGSLPVMEEAAPGITASLAAARRNAIRSVAYDLFFSVPEQLTDPVRGHAVIHVDLGDPSGPLLLDFAQPADRVLALTVGGRALEPELIHGHLVLPSSALRAGRNTIDIQFVAGDEALNRSENYLYTLFVPARASLTFPCFDQPDLKARFSLGLEIPADWAVVANSLEVSREVANGRLNVRFAETELLPTYLFAFTAGRFQVEEGERAGRLFRMFHRETDEARLARNRDAIFDLHGAALTWLEEYTASPYPFDKFDIVLIPAFQFTGMEHPGAILYNAPALLLDESATQNQELARASVIAHETAHMWFGNLVTMRWFNDVWMKEVFANFMAAKIVNPSFPEIDHDLRFMLAHHPAAYAVDRTEGANPIRQSLDNLNEAGSLYGPIIYQKAPVVMRQLEAIVGEAQLRDALREYLATYRFDNASWPDLIAILDAAAEEDLAAWSHAWVEEPGRPTVHTELREEDGRIAGLAFRQEDPYGRGLIWTQQLRVHVGDREGMQAFDVRLDDQRVEVPGAIGRPLPLYVLPDVSGIGYGWFRLDRGTRSFLLTNLPELSDALQRGSAWVMLWDELLAGDVPPRELLELALRALPVEPDELNVQRILGYLETTYWRFLAAGERLAFAARVENTIRSELDRVRSSSAKAAYFAAFRRMMLTEDGIAWVEDLWRSEHGPPGLTLSEPDYVAIAQELAVREVAGWEAILEEQQRRIENPDRRDRFAFVRPALSADPAVRDDFFAALADPRNRRHEPWVLEAVAYLHHPLRAGQSLRYVRPSLELVEEIRRTGDIFFPKRWLDATLGGHSSAETARIVRAFLDEYPDYPRRLRQLVLQAADDLFRIENITDSRQSSR